MAQFISIGHVQKRSGFIEQDDRRLLSQCAGNHHALTLAIRHLVHRAEGIRSHAHFLQRLHNNRLFFCLHMTYPIGVRSPAKSHYIPAREMSDADTFGSHESHLLRKLLRLLPIKYVPTTHYSNTSVIIDRPITY